MARDPRALAEQVSVADRGSWKALQSLPNIGPAMAFDLLRLGVREPDDLRDRDPDEMYEELGILDGVRHDPCVRDVFAAVIDFARTGEARAWWEFTPERKRESVTH